MMPRSWVARLIPMCAGAWVVVLALLVGGSSSDTVSATGPATAPSAVEVAAARQQDGFVGIETCQVCHEAQTANLQGSVHGHVENPDQAVGGCESCHGPGALHIEDPERVHMIFAAADVEHSAQDRAGQCLSCHVDDAATFDYRSSDHLAGAIDCAACHQPHAAAGRDQLRIDTSVESCLGCHEELRADFNLNERHRVLEGMVTCADCHEQHGSSPRARLGGFTQENCTSCHTDKDGPFLYEHLSVRVEGCTTCHQPHGSVNRHMLPTQNMGELCYSCHIAVPGFHAAPSGDSFRFDTQTNCVNCHSAIHGSNLHPSFLR